jgi:sugar-specific transcriptional regulator TrmB
MYEQSLTQAGLSYPQAIVYEALIKNGQLPAGKLTKKTPFKRGLVYKTLEDLVKFELVEKTEDNSKIALFQAKHPLELQTFAEKKEKEAKNAKLALEGIIGSLTSEYNLISQKPGILFFEGMAGIEEAIKDSLRSRTEIMTYADVETVIKQIGKINKEYAKKRDQLGIKKRLIVPDSQYARDYMKNYYSKTTEVRFIDQNLYPFSALTEIYDNTVCYSTLTDEKKIGVIIQNETIYQMHKSLFEFTWHYAEKV